jgi:hypothetical protein
MKKEFLSFLTLIITAPLIANIIWWHNPTIAIIFGLLYLVFNAFFWGFQITRKQKLFSNIYWGILVMFCLIIIAGGISYFIFALNNFVIIFLIIITGTIPILAFNHIKKLELPKLTYKFEITHILYLLLVLTCFYELFLARTSTSIVSPWHVVNVKVFIFYALATFFLIISYFRTENKTISLILTSIHFLLSTSVALIVYKLGFGYDPIIHQTTEKHILEHGIIHPKPFYYLGQYSLIVWLAKLTQIRIEILDKLLLFGFTVIYLPKFIFESLRSFLKNENTVLICTLLFLALPYTFFINTTPFGLSLFFITAIIFVAIKYFTSKDKITKLYLILFTAASLIIHPLAGLCALIFWIAVLIPRTPQPYKPFLAILNFFIIPLAFIANSGGSTTFAFSAFNINLLYLENHFNIIKDLIYSYGFNYDIFIIILGVTGLIFLSKKFKWSKYYLLGAFYIWVNYLIIKYFLVFNDLIEYERSAFSERIYYILLILLLPGVFTLIYLLINRIINNKQIVPKLFILFLIIFLITSSFYLSYPAKDDYQANHGYSISNADFDAVTFIENNSKGEPYIVLANQTTSSAALKTFGFNSYYNNHFYYPIPTGGELYNLYLDMVNNGPSLETIHSVRELTGVDTVYFSISNYWSDFPRTSDRAKLISTNHFPIANGKINIYKFTK